MNEGDLLTWKSSLCSSRKYCCEGSVIRYSVLMSAITE